jgi:hypothetical protein
MHRKALVKKLVALASLLVLSGSLGVAALFATSAASFAAPRSYATGREPFSLAIGDLNGDGKPDLATANPGASSVSVLRNRGDGSFRARHDYRTGRYPWSVAIGDLNGDRKPDLVTANADQGTVSVNTVSVLLNRGNGSFRARLDYATGLWPPSVAIDDLNGQKPKPGTVLPNGGKVNLVVSRGRMPL